MEPVTHMKNLNQFEQAYYAVRNLRPLIVRGEQNPKILADFERSYEIIWISIVQRLRSLVRCNCDAGSCRCPEPKNVDDLAGLVGQRLEKHFASRAEAPQPLPFMLVLCRSVFLDELKKFKRKKRGTDLLVYDADNETEGVSAIDRSYFQRWQMEQNPRADIAQEIPAILDSLIASGELQSHRAEIFLDYHVGGKRLKELAELHATDPSTISRWNEATGKLLRTKLQGLD